MTTANLAWDQEQLPAYGVYVTEVRGSHVPGVRLGVTNVGEKYRNSSSLSR